VTFLNDDRLLWFINRGTGVVLLVVMTLALTLGVIATVRTSSSWWPRFVTQALHRNLALLSLGLLAAHVAAAIIDGFVDIQWIDAVIPFGSGYQTFWVALGTIALDLAVLATLTSLARHRFGQRRWRLVHLTTYLAWPLALAHGLGMGTDQQTMWSMLLTAICVGLVAGALAIRLSALAHERRLEAGLSDRAVT
jgi:sulfoxide reductase heme-binding subunit YedZ